MNRDVEDAASDPELQVRVVQAQEVREGQIVGCAPLSHFAENRQPAEVHVRREKAELDPQVLGAGHDTGSFGVVSGDACSERSGADGSGAEGFSLVYVRTVCGPVAHWC